MLLAIPRNIASLVWPQARALRNLGAAGMDIANFTGRATGKAATGLLRWAATDHFGKNRIYSLPGMGLFESIKFALIQLVSEILGAVLAGVLAFLMIGLIAFMLGGG